MTLGGGGDKVWKVAERGSTTPKWRRCVNEVLSAMVGLRGVSRWIGEKQGCLLLFGGVRMGRIIAWRIVHESQLLNYLVGWVER